MNFNNLVKLTRFWFLIAISYLRRFKFWVLSAIVLIALISFAQIKFHLFFQNNILREGFIGTFQEQDLPIQVTSFISQSLVGEDSSGRIKPNLVSGWDTNNDATEFRFKLKDGLKWSDGAPIKSSDIAFDIPNTNVSYPDEKIIQFNLKEPYSPLPSLLQKPIFKKGSLIGIGPYRVSKIEKSRVFITKIILESSDEGFPKLYIRFYPNEKVAVTGFNLGEVDALFGLSNPKGMDSNPLIKLVQRVDYLKIATILYNTKDPNLLSNRSIRQALSFQAPKVSEEEVANNPYPPSSWAYNSDSKKYLSNPDEAKLALDRAKTAMSQDKLKDELVLTAAPNLEEVGKVLISSWKDLGFDVKIRVEPGIPQNFQALLITQSIPSDPDQYSLWHATQTGTNLSKLDSKRIDKDLEDGRKAISEPDRKAKYFDFQKALLEESPATFLYFPKYNVVYLKKVELMLNKILNLQI